MRSQKATTAATTAAATAAAAPTMTTAAEAPTMTTAAKAPMTMAAAATATTTMVESFYLPIAQCATRACIRIRSTASHAKHVAMALSQKTRPLDCLTVAAARATLV